MRTLIISDLHLGNRTGHDVLRLPRPRARLLESLDDIDRLVLLGDTIELMTRHARRSMAIAEPILRAIGNRLGREREIVLVPGNHDASLVRSWALARGETLGLDETVAPHATPALERVVSWLSPARVSVRYPGLWLDDRVFAIHGHYLDRHLLPESAFGLPRGNLSNGTPGARPIEYERLRRKRRDRGRHPERWLSRLRERPVATLLESTAELVRTVTLPRLPVMLKNAQMTSLTVGLLDAQMRHASLPAMGHVVRRLGVRADWVVFGHVHRTGPLNDERWPESGLLNTGSWMFEPLLLDRACPPHPYWPGGAVLLENGSAPRAVGLLDDLPASDLRQPRRD